MGQTFIGMKIISKSKEENKKQKESKSKVKADTKK